MAQVEEALGGIDVVVNNAANDDRHSVAEVTPPIGTSVWRSTCATSSLSRRPLCPR
jgi:NAD(P)-dependent dehydrogenase (short-subunit alcohol dehydrogenase family)